MAFYCRRDGTVRRSELPIMEDASMTSDNVTQAEPVEPCEAAPSKSVDDRLIDELVGRAQAEVFS